MKFEKITPGTLAAQFCPWLTLYTWTQPKFPDVIQFAAVYYKLIEGFGRPTQWDTVNSHYPKTHIEDLDEFWWVSHQTNTVYLTTEKQLIYCELVFGNIEFLEVQYGE